MAPPSLLGHWWQCCRCSREVNPALYGESCPDCGHGQCPYYCSMLVGSSSYSSSDKLPAIATLSRSSTSPLTERTMTPRLSTAHPSESPTQPSSSSAPVKGARRPVKPKRKSSDEHDSPPNEQDRTLASVKKAPKRRGRQPAKKKGDATPQQADLQSEILAQDPRTDSTLDGTSSMGPRDRNSGPSDALSIRGEFEPSKSDVNHVNSNKNSSLNYLIRRMGSLFHSQPPEDGFIRVTWTCTCGANLYDDYEELEDGAARELQKELRNLLHPAYTRQRWTPTGILSQASSFAVHLIVGISNLMSGTYRIITNKRSGHPIHELESQPQLQHQSHGSRATEKLFLLLCIGGNTGSSAIRAYQPAVHDVDSDRKLFQKLQYYHSSIRKRWWSFISLWELQKIHFVYFDMYEKSLVDIKEINVLPPQEFSTQYRYEASKLKPPIGSNLLMHYLRCPQDASENAPCLRKMPKKLNDQLVACPIQGVSPGWGLHFEEGWSWKKVLTGLCILFILASILVAVLYWRFEHSTQDSLALGTFMFACFSIVIATLQAWLTIT